jgi:hypothetical protein
MKIDFEFQTPYGKFADALYLTENHSLTDSEIEKLKQDRLESWIAIITSPSLAEDTIEIDGELYKKLDGTPPSGAQVVEIEGIWYYKE